MTRTQKKALNELLAASLGGVAGAIATRLLERAGLKRGIAAAGVAAAGSVAVAFTKGTARAAASGVAAAGAGQLAAIWFAALDRRLGKSSDKTSDTTSKAPRRNQAGFAEAIERAFRRIPAEESPGEMRVDRVERDGAADSTDDDGPLIIKEPIGGVKVAA